MLMSTNTYIYLYMVNPKSEIRGVVSWTYIVILHLDLSIYHVPLSETTEKGRNPKISSTENLQIVLELLIVLREFSLKEFRLSTHTITAAPEQTFVCCEALESLDQECQTTHLSRDRQAGWSVSRRLDAAELAAQIARTAIFHSEGPQVCRVVPRPQRRRCQEAF